MNVKVSKKNSNLIITDISMGPNDRITFRNMAGEKDNFGNAERTFNLTLPEDVAEKLIVDGWRVRLGKDDGKGGKYPPAIKIKVNLDGGRPPIIRQYTHEGKEVIIDKHTAKLFDSAEIESAAMEISPYSKKSTDGLATPYLVSMRYLLAEDPLAGLYEGEFKEAGDNGFGLPEDEDELPFE